MLEVLEYIYNLFVNFGNLVKNMITSLISFCVQLSSTSTLLSAIVPMLPAFLGGFVLLFVATRIIYIVVGR